MSALKRIMRKDPTHRTELESAIVWTKVTEEDCPVSSDKAAYELEDKNRAIEDAIAAFRAVIHDLPTAHSDAVWSQVLDALSRLEELK